MMKREECIDILRGWAETMSLNRDRLIELDYVMGDGDLGLTMSDGFKAAYETAEASPGEDLGKLFYAAGKSMASAVPSTMGTLMAAGLMQVGKRYKERTGLDLRELGGVMEAFMQGVMARGGAKAGEKTFVDGIYPAVGAFRDALEKGKSPSEAIELAAAAAREGAEHTRTLVAKHGRAAARGEQSRTLLDPGAYVAFLLVSSLCETIQKLAG